jgi:hypothetical protein
MLNRVVVNIIHVPSPILLIADAMFPKSSLPYPFLPFGLFGWTPRVRAQPGRKLSLNYHPSKGKVMVTFR